MKTKTLLVVLGFILQLFFLIDCKPKKAPTSGLKEDEEGFTDIEDQNSQPDLKCPYIDCQEGYTCVEPGQCVPISQPDLKCPYIDCQEGYTCVEPGQCVPISQPGPDTTQNQNPDQGQLQQKCGEGEGAYLTTGACPVAENNNDDIKKCNDMLNACLDGCGWFAATCKMDCRSRHAGCLSGGP